MHPQLRLLDKKRVQVRTFTVYLLLSTLIHSIERLLKEYIVIP
ncbi:hypothetical protein PPEP_a0965 [Pseudoalteromonas peptidolytica F12-50-A1]|uniref:Uncharacterized protein n=1 Tax=Pseudoalteromonas peptidolytica F12-50-A1 TaxID=1315280 RepID=A0A8I0MV85_9GAMM|nr:hypothetical protein [Pseudoalteromonas peptidolytica F12-50-A1]